MKPAPLTDEEVLTLARNAVKRLGGKLPPGVTHEDAVNDAVVVVLEWAPRWKPRIYPVERNRFLVVRAWSVLKDKYGKEWKYEYAVGKPGARERHQRGAKAKSAAIDLQTEPLAGALQRNPQPDPDLEPRACDSREADEIAMDVREAIAQLPEQQAAVMTLHLEGLTQTAIAKEVGITQPYVSQIIAKAKRALRTILEESYGE